MIVGVPNVGKSSFINRLAGRRAAEASDRPGVTRGKQWIAVGSGLELLDTPGVLWPRFESPEVGLALAWTGAVKDDILDVEMVAAKLMEKLRELYPGALLDRYGLPADPEPDGYELLAAAARRRGYLVSGAAATRSGWRACCWMSSGREVGPHNLGETMNQLDLFAIQTELAAGAWPVCGCGRGRTGPLAGPVFAAAVILPPGLTLPGLDDSKKLTAKRREALLSSSGRRPSRTALISLR
jgi:hypothetical protein